MIGLLVASALGVVVGLTVFFMIRNEVVYRRRMTMIRRIAAAGEVDLAAGRDPMWRWVEYANVPYDDQVLRFRSWDRDPARAER